MTQRGSHPVLAAARRRRRKLRVAKTPENALACSLFARGYTIVGVPLRPGDLCVQPDELQQIAGELRAFYAKYRIVTPWLARYQLVGALALCNRTRVLGSPMVSARAMRVDADAITRVFNALSPPARFSSVPGPWIVGNNDGPGAATPWLLLGAPDAGAIQPLGDGPMVPIVYYALTECTVQFPSVALTHTARWPSGGDSPLFPFLKQANGMPTIRARLRPGSALVVPRGVPVRIFGRRPVLKVCLGCVLGAGLQPSHPALWTAVLGHGEGQWGVGEFQVDVFPNLLPPLSPAVEGLTRLLPLPNKTRRGFYLSRLFRQPFEVKMDDPAGNLDRAMKRHDEILRAAASTRALYPGCFVERHFKTTNEWRKKLNPTAVEQPDSAVKEEAAKLEATPANLQGYNSALNTLEERVKEANDPEFVQRYQALREAIHALVELAEKKPDWLNMRTTNAIVKLSNDFMSGEGYAHAKGRMERLDGRAQKLASQVQKQREKKAKTKKTAPKKAKKERADTTNAFLALVKQTLVEIRELKTRNDPQLMRTLEEISNDFDRLSKSAVAHNKLSMEDSAIGDAAHDEEEFALLRGIRKRLSAYSPGKAPSPQAKPGDKKPKPKKATCSTPKCRRVQFGDTTLCSEHYWEQLDAEVTETGTKARRFIAAPPDNDEERAAQAEAKRMFDAIKEDLDLFTTKNTTTKQRLELNVRIRDALGRLESHLAGWIVMKKTAEAELESDSERDNQSLSSDFRASDDSEIEQEPPSDEEEEEEAHFTGDEAEEEEEPKNGKKRARGGSPLESPRKLRRTMDALVRSNEGLRSHLLSLYAEGRAEALQNETDRVLEARVHYALATRWPGENEYTLCKERFFSEDQAQVAARGMRLQNKGAEVCVREIPVVEEN